MAEILFFVVDKVNDDPVKNRQCYKRGDVIHVAEDGWNWGKEELINPNWRIVKLPGVAVSTLNDLVQPDAVTNGEKTHVIRKRRKHLDLDAPILADAIKRQISTIKNGDAHHVLKARKTKEPIDVVRIGK